MSRGNKIASDTTTATFTQDLPPPLKAKPNSNAFIFNPKRNDSVVNKDSIEALTRATDKLVQGTFTNIEAPGCTACINAKLYKGMDYFYKNFFDGEKCTIPLSVARFINERCFTTSHRYSQNESGDQDKSPIQRPRYKFIIESLAT